jgi:hypothetical protein
MPRVEGRTRFSGGTAQMIVDAASLAVGLAIPVATFTGLWFWRLRPREDHKETTPRTGAELAESVMGMHARLNDLQRQITELGQDWEERDRQLAERISGLIDITAKATEIGSDINGHTNDPGRSGENERGE